MKHITFLSVALFFMLNFFGFSQTEYKIDERRLYNWSGTPDWNQNITEQYTYANGGNKETSLLGLSYPDMDNLYRMDKTYNANNDIVLMVRQSWNSISMQWEDDYQNTYTYYTGTRNVKDVTTYSFALGYDTVKIMYGYSGNDISEIIFQYADSEVLVNAEKYEYSYNSPGNPSEEIESEWNASTSMWELAERSLATYTNGQRTKLEVYNYEGGGWASQAFEQYLTEYSGALETQYTWQSWNGTDWENEDLETSEYDANGNKTVYIFSSWNGADWQPYYKEEMDYSEAEALGVEVFDAAKNLKVFPNPASTHINISSRLLIEKVEVFDVLGGKVLTSYTGEHLNINHLKSGMYILKIHSRNSIESTKIIID